MNVLEIPNAGLRIGVRLMGVSVGGRRLRPTVVGALVLLAAAATLGSPTRAAAACMATPACLEATVPADHVWGELNPGTGGSESNEQFLTVSSNARWGARIASDLSDGRMKEWTGSAYVATDPKLLSYPLQWALVSVGGAVQAPSYRAVSSTPANLVSNQPSTCMVTCSSVQVGVRYRQLVGFGDPPAGANDYRILLDFEAAQGF